MFGIAVIMYASVRPMAYVTPVLILKLLINKSRLYTNVIQYTFAHRTDPQAHELMNLSDLRVS